MKSKGAFDKKNRVMTFFYSFKTYKNINFSGNSGISKS